MPVGAEGELAGKPGHRGGSDEIMYPSIIRHPEAPHVAAMSRNGGLVGTQLPFTKVSRRILNRERQRPAERATR